MFLTASRLDMYWLNVQTLCLSLCFLYVHDLCDNKHFLNLIFEFEFEILLKLIFMIDGWGISGEVALR